MIDEFTTSTDDYPIEGRMLKATVIMNHYETMNGDINYIKEKLIHLISEEIYKSNFVEFSKYDDIQQGLLHFNARVFLVPNGSVKLLRLTRPLPLNNI